MDSLLKRWPLFREVDLSLTSACKFAKMFHYPKVGFLILQNDDVYAVAGRSEDFQWLGNGVHFKDADVNQATKVESLCRKRIIGFYGNSHSISALTEDGCVYSWMCGWHINGYADGIPWIISFPGDKRVHISQVSSGAQHTLYLTSEGEVFCWGFNDEGQLGSGSKRGRHCVPTKISGFDESIVQVEAGVGQCYALGCLGTVWSWGTHDNSSLGYYASKYRQEAPRKITDLPKIQKIAVGNSHALALSETGGLYFWGRFYDKSELVLIPRIVVMDSENPVSDIGSNVNARYAVVQKQNKVYFWGLWSQQHTPKPLATGFSSMEEVFACADPPIMLQSVKAPPTRVVNVWKAAFNDPTTADVRFSVEDQELHALSHFLKLRSPYFRSMFAKEWKESNLEKPIKICDVSFHIFRSFLFFLHNECLLEPEMDMEDLTELMRAADYYQDGDLLTACETKLKNKLTPENVCFVWAWARRYNSIAYAKNLQNYALEFMGCEYDEVVESVDWKGMDDSLLSVLKADLDVTIKAQLRKRRRT